MRALERAQSLIALADPDKTLPLCEIKQIEIGPEALFSIGKIVQDFLPLNSEVGFIIDTRSILRQRLDAKKLVREILSEKFSICVIELDDGYPELHASEEVIAKAVIKAKDLDGLVSLGGGTITDIGKMTSLALGGIPHIAIQTAASVDGFTDNVSVILINGVKRTVPSRWPEALVADTTLIAEAPTLMNRAGYGEINSMFTAPADWRIAALLGFEKKFHWGPIQLLQGVGEGIEEWAPGLRNSEIASTEKLVNALAVRGIVTGVADTTACLSGIEHLISHMLDMHQGSHKLPIGQHGAQVGVGSVFASAIWELIFLKFSTLSIESTKLPDKDVLKEKVFSTFANLDLTLSLAQECWNDYEKKIDFWLSNNIVIVEVLKNWHKIADELRKLIKTPEEIVQGLVSSGSPVTTRDLEPVIDDQLIRWAVTNCHLMRDRFVGIDLLEFCGTWNQSEIDWVFTRSFDAIKSLGVKA